MNTAPSDPSERVTVAASECTNTAYLPAGDALAAAVGGINIGISAAAEDEVRYYGVTMDKGVGLAIGITQLAVFGAAATYGFIQLNRCNQLRREVHLDSPPEPERPATPPPASSPAAAIADAPAPASEGTAPAAPPQHELPSWSALRRFPMTAKPSPSTASPSRYNGSPP